MNTEPLDVVLVRTTGCHLCDDAQSELDALEGAEPLTVRILDATSPEGAAIVARHRPPMFPVVLVDGDLFSWGRLPRRKLHALLDRRTVEAR